MAVSGVKRRFADNTDEDINTKRLKIQSDETIKANKKAANILRQYLTEKQQDTAFETFDATRLAEVLQHFYVDMRKVDGEHYKATSVETTRHALNRYLKSPPYNKKFDIIKDSVFNDANEAFRASIAELKRMGKGSIDHHPVINESDRNKLYNSVHMNANTPNGLFNKVQFDIRLYFCRRANENMHNMTKTTFAVKTDPRNGLKYVTKMVDELTKNHRENDRESSSGMMPESPESPFCPVRTFEKYLSKLHPENDSLWQRPRESFGDEDACWYCNARVGEKTLRNFMSGLSQSCNLSRKYTNHSIRATGATILSRSMFNAAQVMAVTGHKSVQSLAVYQRVGVDEKIMMGQTMTKNLTVQQSLPGSSRPALCPGSETARPVQCNNTMPSTVAQHLAGVDLNTLFGDFFMPQNQQAQEFNTQRQPLMPIMHGNTIGTVNFNIQIMPK